MPSEEASKSYSFRERTCLLFWMAFLKEQKLNVKWKHVGPGKSQVPRLAVVSAFTGNKVLKTHKTALTFLWEQIGNIGIV